MLEERRPATRMITPDRDTFLALAQQGNLVPVYREILADRLTPVSAFEKLTVAGTTPGGNGFAFLLESVEGGERIGRYSFLGSNPSLIFRSKGDRATITDETGTREVPITEGIDPLTLLKELLGRYRYVESPDLPRFCGGAVGFFSYDVVRFFEKLPDQNPDELNVDDACFLFTDTLLLFDHVRHRVKVVCNAHIENNDAEKAYDRSIAKIESLIARLRAPLPDSLPMQNAESIQAENQENRNPEKENEESRNTGKEPTQRSTLNAQRSTPNTQYPTPVQVESLFPRADYEAGVERCRE